MPVQFLSEADHAELNRLPNELSHDDLNAYFYLSDRDLGEVQKQVSDASRLGFATQLCALRFLGFFPDPLPGADTLGVRYLAQQLEIEVKYIDHYPARTRREHQQPILNHASYRRARDSDLAELDAWLLARALERDRPSTLFHAACDHLKKQKLVRIGTTRLAQLVSKARAEAQRVTYQQLQPQLSSKVITFLDGLLTPEATGGTQLAWLQRQPRSVKQGAILDMFDKLDFLIANNVLSWHLQEVNPNRLNWLAGIGTRATNQYLQRAAPERRYPILLSFVHDALFRITDDIIDMVDQYLWESYKRSERAYNEDRLEAAKHLNEQLRTAQAVLAILLDPKVPDDKVREQLFFKLGLGKLQKSYVRNEQLIRPQNDIHLDYFARYYSSIRKVSKRLLSTFEFVARGEDKGLLDALTLVRESHTMRSANLPSATPTGFVHPDWLSYVLQDDEVNRRYHELSTLWFLRQSLRCGEIYAKNSRRFTDLEGYFLDWPTWERRRSEILDLLGAPPRAEPRLTERGQELAAAAKRVELMLTDKEGGLQLEKGRLRQPRLDAQTREERLVKLERILSERLPEVDITDVITEVDAETHFSECFRHLNESQARSPDLVLHLYANLLAQACNLGTRQMAKATGLSRTRLAWHNTWYVRDETLKDAMSRLVNAHYQLPFSQLWGSGSLSSSDGQRFPVKGNVKLSRPQPRYFGYGRGVTFYTWTSDQFSQYGAKPIASPLRDATYVLDEILGNETELQILEHTTDTAGYTDLVFALFDLLGMRFSPRIKDLKDQWLFRTGELDLATVPELKRRFHSRVNEAFIASQWDKMLRLVGSLKTGQVSASLIVQKLQAYPRKHPLLRALQEYGRISKTIHILRWYEDDLFRRSLTRQLNKGEAINGLRSTLRYANEGKVRSQSDEQLGHQVGCLNLLSNILIYWNTLYLQKAVEQLRSEGYEVLDEDLARIWPTRTDHINIYGKYEFKVEAVLERRSLRALRDPGTSFG